MTRRDIRREWFASLRTVAVSVDCGRGPLLRGYIRPLRSPDWRGHWSISDYDANHLGDDGRVSYVGDYLDAEGMLLRATTALDE